MDEFFINSEKQIPKEGDKVVNVTPNSKGTGYLIRFADCITGHDKLISVAVKSEPVVLETVDLKNFKPLLPQEEINRIAAMIEAQFHGMGRFSAVVNSPGYKIEPWGQTPDISEVDKLETVSQDRQRMLDLAIRCGAITNDELRMECGLDRMGTDWGCQMASYLKSES